jgi:hypothetical protein
MKLLIPVVGAMLSLMLSACASDAPKRADQQESVIEAIDHLHAQAASNPQVCPVGTVRTCVAEPGLGAPHCACVDHRALTQSFERMVGR